MFIFDAFYTKLQAKHLFIFILTGTAALYFVFNNVLTANDILLHARSSVKPRINESYNGWTSILGCPLPEVDPWEPEDVQFVGKPPDKIKECTVVKNATSVLENGNLWVNLTGSSKNTSCSYRCLNYKSDNAASPGAWTPYKQPGPAKVTCDWVDVECKDGKRTEYRQVHSQIYTSETSNSTRKRYNVYILGLDAISHSQFHRTMPKTAYFLENELDGINFRHLSKVGYNSVPNQMAALFGQKFTTVRHAPQDYPHFNMSNPYFCKRKHSKDEQYIGFVYNDLGYRTAHIEDIPHLIQVYPNCQGFGFAHTNHSTVPLSAAKDKQFKKAVLSDSRKEEFKLCVEFFEAYIKAKTPEAKFAHSMLTGPGHDKLDDPYKYDDYFYRWLRKIRNDIDDAFLLVWSDHGHHFGPFYPTIHGQTDTRNAMLTVVLPKKLRETPSHPVVQNLRQNSITLVSQYDMFPTLVDLATADFESPASFTQQLTLQNYQKLNNRIRKVHGDSLLRPLTHRTPTCAGLGIPFIFCLCQWPIFTPKDESGLNKVVINGLPPVLNAFIKSIGAENECEEYKVNENKTIEVYEVATKLVNPTSRLIRSKFSITKFRERWTMPFHLQVFFELTTNGTISLAGRIYRYDTGWAWDTCRVEEYERLLCYCKSQKGKAEVDKL